MALILERLRAFNRSKAVVITAAIGFALMYVVLAFATSYSPKSRNVGWPSDLPGRIVDLEGPRLVVHTSRGRTERSLPAGLTHSQWVVGSATPGVALLEDSTDQRIWRVRLRGNQDVEFTSVSSCHIRGRRCAGPPNLETIVGRNVTASAVPGLNANRLAVNWMRAQDPTVRQVALWRANALQKALSLLPVPQHRPWRITRMMALPGSRHVVIQAQLFKSGDSWVYAVELPGGSVRRLPIVVRDCVWVP